MVVTVATRMASDILRRTAIIWLNAIKVMKPIPNTDAAKQSSSEIIDVARAVRFAISVILFGLSYVSIRISFGLGGIEQVLDGMGMALPAITSFIITARPALMFVSIVIPLAALACFWDTNVTRAIYNLGRLSLLNIIQLILLYHGFSAPLVKMVANATASN
jgi:hypothetical protein